MRAELPHGYWNPKIELMPKGKLRRLQLSRVQEAFRYAWENSPFYRRLMEKHGVTPDDILTLEDFFRKFPVTSRQELERDQLENPPFGTRLALPLEEALRYHSTSGTTGKPPVRAFDTERDWIWGADAWATSLYNFGVRPTDIVMVAFGYGSFIGFWGAHYAFEKIGCRVHPTGSMDTKTRIRVILDLNVTVLCCTPSYAIRMLHVASEEGIDLAARSQLSMIVVAGEPGATIPSTKEIIEKGFNAHLGDFMGTTETAGMIASTCSRRCGGLHINEDRYLTEVVDPNTLEPVGYGKKGMMVVTPLLKEAMPLLRYATNDMVLMERGTVCPCGRTLDLFMGGYYLWRRELVRTMGLKGVIHKSPFCISTIYNLQSSMKTALLAAHITVSILLIFAILIQQRGTGLSATFGGGGNFYATKRGAEKILSKITIVLAILFAGLSLGMLFV